MRPAEGVSHQLINVVQFDGAIYAFQKRGEHF